MHMRKTVLFCICTVILVVQSFAQATKVNGKVVDEQGKPVAGVSIARKNSKAVGISTGDGQFAVNADIGDTLVFSSVNYEVQEALAAENLTVTLKATAQSLA